MSARATSTHDPAEHYDRVHAAWQLIMGEEFHYGVFSDPDASLTSATGALTTMMLQAAEIRDGDHVLDVGCGTGRQACQLATRHGASVLGITTSAEGVRRAHESAAEQGVDGVAFEQRDGTDNKLPGGSFDVVWALESSHLMRDRRGLLAESLRVLRPGGRLVLCDITRQREIPFSEVRERRDQFAVLRAAFGDAHMVPLEEYVSMLTELGAEVHLARDLTRETGPTFTRWRDNVTEHTAELEQMLGGDALADFVESTHILEGFWNDGTLGYGIIGARVPT